MTPCRDPSPQKRPRASGTRNSLSLSLFVKLLTYEENGLDAVVAFPSGEPEWALGGDGAELISLSTF